MSQFLKPLRLSEPKEIDRITSSTAGEPTSVSVEGVVFEMVVVNESVDYSLYVSFDMGDTYIEIPPDSYLPVLFGALADPVLLLKSDGASQAFRILYRLRL